MMRLISVVLMTCTHLHLHHIEHHVRWDEIHTSYWYVRMFVSYSLEIVHPFMWQLLEEDESFTTLQDFLAHVCVQLVQQHFGNNHKLTSKSFFEWVVS